MVYLYVVLPGIESTGKRGTLSMSPREESNLDQRLRSPQFYPLNYRGRNIVTLWKEELAACRIFLLVEALHFFAGDLFHACGEIEAMTPVPPVLK